MVNLHTIYQSHRYHIHSQRDNVPPLLFIAAKYDGILLNKQKMQLDVEVSPPAFVRPQLELECTCSVPGVYVQSRLKCTYMVLWL